MCNKVHIAIMLLWLLRSGTRICLLGYRVEGSWQAQNYFEIEFLPLEFLLRRDKGHLYGYFRCVVDCSSSRQNNNGVLADSVSCLAREAGNSAFCSSGNFISARTVTAPERANYSAQASPSNMAAPAPKQLFPSYPIAWFMRQIFVEKSRPIRLMPPVFHMMLIKVFGNHLEPGGDVNTLRTHKSALAAIITQTSFHSCATQHEIIILVAQGDDIKVPVGVDDCEIILNSDTIRT